MATSNFCTMRDFPLLARDFYEPIRRCPECGAINEENDKACYSCGCDSLSDVTYEYDEFAADLAWQSITDECSELNSQLMFHKVSLRSGYYCGVQFYVDVEHDLTEDEYDNNDCHYYFDCCRSVAHRKYQSEIRKIARFIRQLGKEYGFDELVVTARFSNGETCYGLASIPRNQIKAAIVGASY